MAAATRRTGLPLRVRLYVWTVAALALLLLPFSSLWGAGFSVTTVAEALLLSAVVAVVHRRPVQIGLKRKLDVGTAPEVAAVLLLPGPLAVAALVAGNLIGEAAQRTPLIQRCFNAAVAALRAIAGLAVGALLLQIRPAALAAPVAAIATIAVMYIAGTLLVVGVAALQLRENPLRRAWAVPRDVLVAEGALGLTGVMAALATADHAWALPLLVAPAAIAHRALRDGIALQAQTRLALEDLADIVDMRDHYTFEHSRRVAELARATARRLELSPAEIELITMAGRVHDVGKIGIKSSVLMKPGRLTDTEFEEMRSHPVVGARLIGNFPQFARGRAYVLHHHERFDGKGYPKGLAGDDIPLGARVLAVADAWDAMTSHRAYRQALDLNHVYGELERGRGTQFDPAVLDAFLHALAERPDLAVQHTAETQDVDAVA